MSKVYMHNYCHLTMDHCIFFSSFKPPRQCKTKLFVVGLASGLGQYTEVVREAQKGIKLRNVRFVDAKGLPLEDGHLHLSTQAQVQLGHMLAQAYLNYGTSTL
ncbi:Os03g0857500 [Oryza sativa Japonica Group]|uniref:Expressed protein n=1 Tax=Oryza sativa subsp. japonica TaxID=39947 RepID=Q10AC1_ORYSJ|nr:expressed protein [Oryza sativa Japonica Group]KAB8094563.1 hypothetical protein EE612_021762 [Oryza sativa]BAG88276.1 unnamed protein product [Oryza sativa Japonica Group]BAS87459.1 Os03g0857500 [Oryza sativa Japonica Group]